MAQSMSHQQHLLRDSWLNAAPIPPSTSARRSSSLDRSSESGRETIHSGHFMVSTFEAEAQDDEDTEIAMPDPDESGALAELNACTDVVLAGGSGQSSQVLVSTSTRSNSSAVIDISLAKLFKCMNLAYRWAFCLCGKNTFAINLYDNGIFISCQLMRLFCWHKQFESILLLLLVTAIVYIGHHEQIHRKNAFRPTITFDFPSLTLINL